METEKEYSYKGEDEKCEFIKKDVKVYINSSVSISSDETGQFRVATHQGKVREIQIFLRSGNCQGILQTIREILIFWLMSGNFGNTRFVQFHHHPINVYSAIIKQIVSRSEFYVDLSSEWYILLINDFLKSYLAALEMARKDVLVSEI